MLEHIETAQALAAGIEGGKILGSVGSGGLAIGLTAVLVTGIREPKKGGKVRRKLSPTEASVVGVTAGTAYMAAGSIWTTGKDLSEAFSAMFTQGDFGSAGLGGVSLFLAAIMYFREMRPGFAALTGIVAAGVWSQAGGIWGLPESVILTTAGALGAS
ncbi:hypothetical protein [Streptomyces sp. sk2.1]|uniref:hypothetical protein n=1 Tax=Streptomyces sp. sk2.1 TaxID=2478959 RepID=UPI0011E78B8E|nr:hypothetical protein [Streptomyces sp. sk2.1]TXS78679.1 hypothetical protein EAO76_09985 [Streptomyces sp. sk2.1]